jgi:hypothetical protein
LINEIAAKAGITTEQATIALTVMQETNGGANSQNAVNEPIKEEGFIDQLKEKAGGLLHNIEGNEMVHKAEEMLGGVNDKIAGLFK